MSDKKNNSSNTFTTAAYTVVTPNYLAHAWSLKKSFLQHNLDAEFFICILGDESHYPDKNLLNVYFINNISDDRIKGMILRYNPFELSCAIKPFFATHILEDQPGLQRLIYLDSDMYVFGVFTPLTDAAITLSPHRTKNIGFLPVTENFSFISLNRYGVYNAGYFELQRKGEAMAFLDWWKVLMEKGAFNKPDEHLFTDQPWLNAVPSFFDDIYINKNPGYNVAYWNLIERRVEEKEGSIYVNGEPLVLFHFAKYKVEEPEKMTDFQNDFLSFATFPELKPIFRKYHESLLEEGYEKIKLILYPFYNQKARGKKSGLKKLFF